MHEVHSLKGTGGVAGLLKGRAVLLEIRRMRNEGHRVTFLCLASLACLLCFSFRGGLFFAISAFCPAVVFAAPTFLWLLLLQLISAVSHCIMTWLLFFKRSFGRGGRLFVCRFTRRSHLVLGGRTSGCAVYCSGLQMRLFFQWRWQSLLGADTHTSVHASHYCTSVFSHFLFFFWRKWRECHFSLHHPPVWCCRHTVATNTPAFLSHRAKFLLTFSSPNRSHTVRLTTPFSSA